MTVRLPNRFTQSNLEPGGRAPGEIITLRLIGFGVLMTFLVVAALNEPGYGFTGESLLVLLGSVAFVATAFATVPIARAATGTRIGGIALMTALAAGLVQVQPDGLWVVTPYLVASVAGMLLSRRDGMIAFLVGTAVVLGSATIADRGDAAWGILVGVIPWFLFMRVLRRVREEHEVTKGLLRELEASRAAEAVAAAENERARVAREMHDVLAHTLSSLALQLESTRMLARSRDVDPEVVDAVARAHGIASGGLEEARRAIGALRGEDLPGPDRLPALVEAFRTETGVSCTLDVAGTARPLAGDARLAIYRTAQEALTNVRKHAPDASSVALTLTWSPESVGLVVADRAPAAVPSTGDGGYGLTGMRERAELLGGALAAGATEDGFRVELVLPAEDAGRGTAGDGRGASEFRA